jgi:DNA helicase II / ATP-dependent DNA helicase PcrA
VGITRAKEYLQLSYARNRRLYGDRQPAIMSQFLKELSPEKLGGATPRRRPAGATQTRVAALPPAKRPAPARPAPAQGRRQPSQAWAVGDRVTHDQFGTGQVTHVLGAEPKLFLAISFPGLGKKVIDPKLVALRKLSN